MPEPAFSPQNWTRPLAGYRAAGWIAAAGPLAAAFPLQLSQGGWYPLAWLAAGLLPSCAGLFYLIRAWQVNASQARPIMQVANAQVSGYTVRVIARKLAEPDEGEAAGPKAQEKGAANPAEDARQAAALMGIGIFLLLMAAAGFLLRLANIENVLPAAAFLGSPAILLWAVIEGLAFAAHWQMRPTSRQRVLGIVRSGSHALAALLLWVFLGLASGASGTAWLFWPAAGLALLGALAGSIIPETESRLETTMSLDSAGVEKGT